MAVHAPANSDHSSGRPSAAAGRAALRVRWTPPKPERRRLDASRATDDGDGGASHEVDVLVEISARLTWCSRLHTPSRLIVWTIASDVIVITIRWSDRDDSLVEGYVAYVPCGSAPIAAGELTVLNLRWATDYRVRACCARSVVFFATCHGGDGEVLLRRAIGADPHSPSMAGGDGPLARRFNWQRRRRWPNAQRPDRLR